jgi:hypothetical protein
MNKLRKHHYIFLAALLINLVQFRQLFLITSSDATDLEVNLPVNLIRRRLQDPSAFRERTTGGEPMSLQNQLDGKLLFFFRGRHPEARLSAQD